MPRHLTRPLATLALCALAIAALPRCADEAAAPLICAPGLVQVCPCPGGAQGAQRCDDDGARWGVCVCPEPASSPDMTRADMPGTTGDMDARDMPGTTRDMDDPQDMGHTPDMPGATPPCTTPATDETARAEGAHLFAQHCAACHGARGQGNAVGPALWEEVAEEPDRKLIKTMREGDDDMPPTVVTEAQARLIIGYLLWEAELAGERIDASRCDEHDHDD